MEFAKRMLEKYGWNEGQGLGKNSNGITTALKPKVKLNGFGLGHDGAKDFTDRWWEDAYNEAASNVHVEKLEDCSKVKTVNEEAVEVPAVRRSIINRDKVKYNSFLKRETLTKGGGIETAPETEFKSQKLVVELPAILSDEELFRACGGLTAHKGARHGLTLKGKLQRVREQEEALLKAYQQNRSKESKNAPGKELRGDCVVLENEQSDKSKSKKKKKHENQSFCGESEELCTNGNSEKEKKRKRKLDCQIEEEHSEDVESENKESKKSKKKRKHEIPESVSEDTAEASEIPCENEASEKMKRKKRKSRKVQEEEEVFQQDESNTQLEKTSKKKKKKRKEDTEG